AVMDMMPRIGYFPDILHAHDWQAALSVVYLDAIYRTRPGYGNIRTVFTIHNIEYQGKYSFAILGDIFSLDQCEASRMDFGGCINLMKGAIVSADRVSTVSPRYAEEICTPEYAHGLDPILRAERGKLLGILNGIDYTYYNPAKDKVIPSRFGPRTRERKTANKTALQASLGLDVRTDAPMIAVISRLVAHKGLDIVAEMIWQLLAEEDAQLVVLGCGDKRFEEFFLELESAYPNKVRALLRYDRDLAKQIYAACDIFLMPSKSEPCGLSQMIASRYGAIPVVRETGGLYDSIKGYWEKDGRVMGNGFTFANYDRNELYERTKAAIALWRNPEKRDRLIAKIMSTDFSWKQSAQGYDKMYSDLM
ncbi:MAG: glycogen synthase, partial [Clostridia bacterium]|nr:glycogen synthase [Clostridia bacterium]